MRSTARACLLRAAVLVCPFGVTAARYDPDL